MSGFQMVFHTYIITLNTTKGHTPMSVASPKNRQEFKEYILSKLGAPVLQVNVADEQLDIAINDAFQYWNERSHFNGTERIYLTWPCNSAFIEHFTSFENNLTEQGPGPVINKAGMVDELTLTTAGTKYSYVPEPAQPVTNVSGGDLGSGLTVWMGEGRTTDGGLTTVRPMNAGSGYQVGDVVSISGTDGGTAATATVAKIKTESKLFGVQDVRQQNNFITLPDDVVGITKVFHRGGFGMAGGGMGGMIPGAAIGPMFLGSMFGGDAECNSIGYDIVTYVAMREYMATLNFLFFPPIQYDFNQRTHRLFIDAKRIVAEGGGGYICVEAMVKPSPDIFPDVWNDLWLKEYATALTQLAWGRNLTKYNNVQMPGGITLNGEKIYNQAMDDIKILRERFSMDWADPPLDLVG
jgi:hypothetical protein